jgi:hypothetical protein
MSLKQSFRVSQAISVILRVSPSFEINGRINRRLFPVVVVTVICGRHCFPAA